MYTSRQLGEIFEPQHSILVAAGESQKFLYIVIGVEPGT